MKPTDLTVAELFAQVMARVPGDRQVYQGDQETLTYADLDLQSRRLAAHIQGRIGPGSEGHQRAIALLLPHSGAVFVGILGVLRSGHFYLPLDGIQGRDFQRGILTDCPAALLVSTRSLESAARELTSDSSTELHFLEDLASEESSWQPPRLPPSSLAAILYTSGSSGKPRGVVRTHTLFTLLVARLPDQGQGPGRRTAFLSSYVHAFANRSIFTSFLTGSTAFGNNLRKLSPVELCRWLRDHRINQFSCPPGTLRAIGALTDPVPLPDLELVNVGMEPISRADVEAFCRWLPLGCRVQFVFATTESGSISDFVVEVGKPWVGERTRAGTPDPFVRVEILDEGLRPVPPGTVGQIGVYSRFLGPGYWNRPEETSARFHSDPQDPQGQLYLTGDLGVFGEDGLLEHRGRMDDMVKIRGYRIEPAAIEAVLGAHPAVSEAVVVTFPTSSGNARLAAHCLLRSGSEVAGDDLRAFLAERLPSPQIPSRFLFPETLPRLASGKVDRKALPAPGSARPLLSTPMEVPQNEGQQRLADLWAEILDLDEVGINDNFFHLGGDSLSALEMTHRAEAILGHPIPPDVLDALTIANLGTEGDEASGPKNARPVPASPKRPTLRVPRIARPLRTAILGLYYATTFVGWGAGLYLWSARIAYGASAFSLAFPSLAKRHKASYRALLEATGETAATRRVVRQAVQIRLLQILWGYFLDALTPGDLERVSTIEGAEVLLEARASGNPVLCVAYHSPIHRLTGPIFDRLKIPSTGIFPPVMDPNNRAASAANNTVVLKAAESSLRQGRVVRIFPDGEKGTRPVMKPFFGVRRPFYPGFAELAVRENAVVIPMGVTINAEGRVTLTFGPGFADDRAQRTPQRVEALQDQYVAYLEARWRADPANVAANYVNQFLALPAGSPSMY